MESLKEQKERVEREVREKLTTYLGAAFGFVAGLAWNDAVKSLIDYFFPMDHGGIAAKFIYALAVTLILVVVTIGLQRTMRQKQD